MSEIYLAFVENNAAIRRVFARYFQSRSDIDDLMQELFLKCYTAEKSSKIRKPTRFLLRAAKNLALSEVKKKFRTTTGSIEDIEPSNIMLDETSATPEAILDSRRKLATLAMAIAALPPHYKKAFWMRRIENLKLAEIASKLGISISTAKKHTMEALLLCEAYLVEHGYRSEEIGATGIEEMGMEKVIALKTRHSYSGAGGRHD